MPTIGTIINKDGGQVQIADTIRNNYTRNNEKAIQTTHRILFISACPESEQDLKFTKELSTLKNTIQSIKSLVLGLDFCLDTSINDFQNIIYKYNPDILYISVHGETNALLFIDEEGKEATMDIEEFQEVITELLEIEDCKLKLIVISACNSLAFAEAISGKVAIIGMNGFIPVEAANLFTEHFYKILLNTDDITKTLSMAFNNTKRVLKRKKFTPQSGVEIHEMPTLFNH